MSKQQKAVKEKPAKPEKAQRVHKAKINSSPAKERHSIQSLEKKKAKVGWLFVLPFLAGFVLVYIPIIFDSLRYSFYKITIKPGGGNTLEFVGFKNYQAALFDDQNFVSSLRAGIQTLILEIPAILLFSLFIAILLNQKMVGRSAFRAIFFIPVILTTGLIAEIDAGNTLSQTMGSTTDSIETGAGGTSAEIVSAVDLEKLFSGISVLSSISEYVVGIVNNILNIVNRSGVQMLIFLAGLQSISPAIYESCEIEGASAWETFWKITLPMISPMILVNAVYTVIDSFTSESNKVMQYISTVYQNTGDGNVRSSAMAWMYFLLVILIVAVVAGIIRLFVFYQRRD